MKILKFIFLAMMLFNSTVLLGQIQAYHQDDSTKISYNLTELRIIASALIDGTKNDSLNKVLENQVQGLYQTITTQEKLIENQKVNIELLKAQSNEYSKAFEGVSKQLTTEIKNHKKTKAKFGIITVLSLSATLALLITR